MENLEIAGTLTELADLLEIQGANPFRIRAYRNAAKTLQELTRPAQRMLAEGEDLTALPGIGKDIAGAIAELVDTGRLARLEALSNEIPRGLVDLTRVSGVGPKKARKLWDELGITTLDELEGAAKSGKVATLEGFGARSAEKILKAIAGRRLYEGRMLLSEADELIRPLLAFVAEIDGVERVEAAGSYRRRKETIGDLDILAEASPDVAAAVIERFVGYPGVAEVTGSGGTKGSVVLRSGLAVDLRVLPNESFGAALQYFTGSKEHNIEMRALAVRMGLRVNEWGVFRVPEDEDEDEGRSTSGAGSPAGTAASDPTAGERLAGAEEEDVYRALGMAWMPPTLRENRGEVERSRNGTLPTVVTRGDLLGELHMHSTWSDGTLDIAGMVRECRARGYRYAVITDHTPAVGVAGGLDPQRVREQWEEIERVRETLDGFELLRGLEVDILKDGSLDTTDEVLEGLDFVIVSVHSFMDQDESTMTDRVVRAVSHPAVDMLAHPTGRKLNRRAPYPIDVETVLQAAAAHSVAVEINAHPRRLDLSDVHAYRARELGVPVAVTTDAHSASDLDHVSYGIDQAQRAWLEAEHVLNARSASEFRSWLRRRAN